MKLHLIDVPILNLILEKDWKDLYNGLEKGTFREIRPKPDPRLSRAFDIDSEAQILDLMDNINGSGKVQSVLKNHRAYELLLEIMCWASTGYWDAWEGRCFIYIEQATGQEIEHVDELYEPQIWDRVRKKLKLMNENEYSELVCSNWMKRRTELGETLNEKEDPHIIPTFEAHDRASRTLHHAVNQVGYAQIIGREHMPAQEWGHGKWNLQQFLEASD